MAIWYVRTDGGTTTQSTGHTDAPYPGSGSGTASAYSSVQDAINAAALGDTINIRAGDTFTTGSGFNLPNKSGSTYLTIQSSAVASLPAGTRVSPSSVSNMPKLQVNANNEEVITVSASAHHYQLIGLEITMSSSSVISQGAIVSLEAPSQTSLSVVPHHIVIDRCYIHGVPGASANRRGIQLGSSDTTIKESYVSEFKEVGGESQAIGGWNGPGPYTITNNHIEGATQNLMFGGSDTQIANMTPADILIQDNYFFKPLSWMGSSYPVKNVLELKHAKRVVINCNTFENYWQAGQEHAIVFTVRNQDGNNPWATVQEVDLTNNVFINCFAFFNIYGTSDLHPTQPTHHINVSNNLVYDSLGSSGKQILIGVTSGGYPANLTIEHNTLLTTIASAVLLYGAQGTTAGASMIIRNNIFEYGTNGILGDAVGEGQAAINAYISGATVTHNVWITTATDKEPYYPSPNYFVLNDAAVGFTNIAANNYRLLTSSSFDSTGPNWASDFTDIGVDVDFLPGAVGDTTLPSGSITAPSNGATVSGTISVTANASDNVAVAGVQFKRDSNVNIGSEDTSSPYSVSLDTTALANGAHTVYAVVRDTSNNLFTTSTVNITVNNSPEVTTSNVRLFIKVI